jgi:hypothetical protein
VAVGEIKDGGEETEGRGTVVAEGEGDILIVCPVLTDLEGTTDRDPVGVVGHLPPTEIGVHIQVGAEEHTILPIFPTRRTVSLLPRKQGNNLPLKVFVPVGRHLELLLTNRRKSVNSKSLLIGMDYGSLSFLGDMLSP